jgi:hypothetical protein
MIRRVAILSVGVDSWYPRGIDRLRRAAERIGFPAADVLTWRDEYPPGSPSHQIVLYGFKAFAFEEAKRRGYDQAIWMDASCWPIRPLDELVLEIGFEGYAFFNSGWRTGQWCSDRALPLLGITREESFAIPMIAATCMGVDLQSEPGEIFLREFSAHARDTSFNGPATNELRQASADARVLGHRYDQTAASVIVHRHRFKITEPPRFFRYWTDPAPPETCIVARGMRGDENEAEIQADLTLGDRNQE